MFRPNKDQAQQHTAFVYLPGTANEAYAIGEALVLTDGGLTKCGALATPEYICQKTAASATVAPTLPVEPVVPNREYETTIVGDATDVLLGNKVTLHTDGAQVTITETGGVFEITYKGGNSSGSVVCGRFPAA